MKTTLILLIGIFFFSCKSETKKEQEALNISIFLDLSDRLERSLSPSQMSRDTAIISYLCDYFRNKTLGPQILNSRNNIRVFFYPTPDEPEIATLAQNLSVDMASLKGIEKRTTLENMKENFLPALSQIYSLALKNGKAKKWPGCDIWDFFSHKKVDQLCLRPGARNVLIILTDGYLYYAKNIQQEGNAFSYIVPKTLANPNSSLIVKRQGLENLEVLMLEINPFNPKQREPLIHVLENWFKAMGVEKFLAVETDLPSTTQTIIKNFLD